MSEIVQIAILSRNEIVREGLRRILADQGFIVEQAVSNAADLESESLQAAVILVDSLDLDDGLTSCEDLRERYPDARIVLMVDEYKIDNVARAFASGAVDGYLVKAISCEPLAGALRLVAMGEKLLPSQIADSLSNPIMYPATHAPELGGGGPNLSSREVEILRCLVDGDANKVISRRLDIADATVKVHIKAILRKLRVKNRTQAAIWAVSRGFVQESEAPRRSLVA